MKLARLVSITIVATLLLTAPVAALAQGTIADYQRAMGLRDRFDGLAVDVPEAADWIGETTRFWYRKSVVGGDEFVIFDATTQQKRPAFDHARIAAALSEGAEEPYSAVTLPFRTIEFVDNETAIEFPLEGTIWKCDLTSYVCESTGRAVRGGPGGRGQGNDEPRVSPDGAWEAFIDNFNVVVREPGSDELVRLSMDGSEGEAYELSSIVWSPDSTQIGAYRVRPGYVREIPYIESSPADQLQPKHWTREYTKPGDRLDKEIPVIFDVAARAQHQVDDTLFPNAYAMSRLVWREDSSAVTFEYNQRGHQVFRVIEVDADDGSARALINEEMETFFHYSGKKFRHDVNDGEEIIWMSERDGWNHLYMYDGATGAVKHQITSGAWPVREVIDVDEENRHIYFVASGMIEGQDPYFEHAYRIDFDGTGLIAFTSEDANHQVVFSPDKQYYVDRYSRVDMAPVAELRRSSDQSLVVEIERSDISTLVDAGWEAPEVFVAKGRDGVTDIWGVIFRPTNFDANRTYPVIENIYAGPHDSFVPKSFQEYNGMREIAELGFIVVQIDGMGTSNRSKAFHDVAWMNLKDAGFPDRILWHQAVAARYPYYDIDRVGIYGTSAGGQSSLGGLLFHPDFYDVAVSAVGCHDNRMDKIWWNEQWMGWPIGPHYAESSNVDNAWRLQGDVLLIVGELDTNVDPASTMQVVDALIKANKPFDLLVIPGANHTSGGDYGQHKRFDYFVENLYGIDPPEWADLEAALGEDGAAGQG
ncbi:MAG: DPP IV N-terminal domain-containing protein, partial [Deltaproteobacteria bacterium]|nr:DPP IV N-terminal domain-containing protein [Deltaproteobacteria bacterium]